jgi:indole-3-acetate monooxygenase
VSPIADPSDSVASKNDPAAILIQRARDIGTLIQGCRDEIDTTCHLPAKLVEALRTAGMFRLFVPAEFGGCEVSPITFTKIIEEIAAVDGATGWVVSVCAVGGLFAGYMQKGASSQIYGADPDAIVAGGINPTGQAAAVTGGYLVSGRWSFGSGIQHASWVYGSCIVYENGRPRLNAVGAPEARLMLVPASECQIHDTWHVGGLRGTGSHDFSVKELFVPEDLSLAAFTGQATQPGNLYRFPFSLFAVLIAAVPLGIAKGAISALVEIARTKKPIGSPGLLSEKPSAQIAVARAEALYRSGRAFLFEMLEAMGSEIAAGNVAGMRSRADLRLACTQAAVSSTQAVDLVFEAAGGTAVYTSCPLERYFRDVHTAMQHIAVSSLSLECAGRVLFGFDPGTQRF